MKKITLNKKYIQNRYGKNGLEELISVSHITFPCTTYCDEERSIKEVDTGPHFAYPKLFTFLVLSMLDGYIILGSGWNQQFFTS